jgi:hypothetical protein
VRGFHCQRISTAEKLPGSTVIALPWGSTFIRKLNASSGAHALVQQSLIGRFLRSVSVNLGCMGPQIGRTMLQALVRVSLCDNSGRTIPTDGGAVST